MIGEDTNCVGGMGMVKSMFDESRTPSPQYLHDSEVYIPQTIVIFLPVCGGIFFMFSTEMRTSKRKRSTKLSRYSRTIS